MREAVVLIESAREKKITKISLENVEIRLCIFHPKLDKEARGVVGRKEKKQRKKQSRENHSAIKTERGYNKKSLQEQQSKRFNSKTYIFLKKKKMGIVAFNWAEDDNNQLTLVMNRDNCDKRAISGASWDDHILSGRCEENNGTWLGISKRGRVAFLVDTLLLVNVDPDYECSEMYPITFLESDMSPRQFSCYVAQRERQKQELRSDEDNGWPFCLIVADMTLNSMYHIRKPLQGLNIIIQPVPFGVHTLSPRGGLDSTEYPRDLRLRGFFNQMIGDLGNDQLPPLKEIAEGYMYDAEGGEDSVFYNQQFGNVRYGTTSTTVLAVQRTEGVTLFERYMDSSGAWCEHDFDFTFNID